MNPPRCSDEDYINFMIASPRQVSATEAAKVQSEEKNAPAPDAFTRLLHRLEPDAEERPHSSLKYQTPVEFRLAYQQSRSGFALTRI